MLEKVQKSPLIADGQFTIAEVKELNFFDLSGSKAKTKGSSAKSYIAELQISKNGDECQIYTIWGATGAANQTKEWRHYSNRAQAEKDFAAIIKSKINKGYVEIDVAQRALGSSEAKAITKAVTLNNVDKTTKTASALHPEVQRVVAELFNVTNNWTIKTLKCPLGQLTNNQIDKGRALLDEAQTIVNNNNKLSKNNLKDIERITNDFYSAIPHNLGQGFRGQMTQLLLDDKLKIAQKSEDLDLLLDAKAMGASLNNDAQIDEKYKSMQADICFVENESDEFKWINKLLLGTRASNHHYLGKIKLLTIWKVARKNEDTIFIKNTEKIAKECGKIVIPDIMKNDIKNRPNLSKELEELYSKSNTLPLWHGTKDTSLLPIIRNGFLIRPSGAIITGAMYGSCIYKSSSSTKSINYTNINGSYWAKGNKDKAFMFLSDATLGNQLIATGARQYTRENIKPYHSVWAKGGSGGVINDEFMLYNQSGENQQHCIRYLLEFTCLRN